MWWSWGLSLVGIAGLILAGSKKKSGWALGIAAQALWFTFAIVTHQYGFILGSVAYASVYIRNYVLWRREDIARRESGD